MENYQYNNQVRQDDNFGENNKPQSERNQSTELLQCII